MEMEGKDAARSTDGARSLDEESAVSMEDGNAQGTFPAPPPGAATTSSKRPEIGHSSSDTQQAPPDGVETERPDIDQRKKREITGGPAEPSQERSKSPKRDSGKDLEGLDGLEDEVLVKVVEDIFRGGGQPLFSDILNNLRLKNPGTITANADVVYKRMMQRFTARPRSGEGLARMIRRSYEAENPPTGSASRQCTEAPAYLHPAEGDSAPSPTATHQFKGTEKHADSTDATNCVKSRGRNSRPANVASKTLPRSKAKGNLFIRSARMGVVNVTASRMPTVAGRVKSLLPAALLELDQAIHDEWKPIYNAVRRLQDGLNKGARSNFRDLVTSLEDAFRSLRVPSTLLPGVSELERHLSSSLADVRNERTWRQKLEPGACVICSRVDVKQAQEELTCSVCEEVIQIGGEYFINIKNPESGVRCLVHRNQGVPRHSLDDVVQISHKVRLAPVVSCEECCLVEHVACGMHVPSPNNGLEGAHLCSPCRNRMKNDAEQDIPLEVDRGDDELEQAKIALTQGRTRKERSLVVGFTDREFRSFTGIQPAGRVYSADDAGHVSRPMASVAPASVRGGVEDGPGDEQVLHRGIAESITYNTVEHLKSCASGGQRSRVEVESADYMNGVQHTPMTEAVETLLRDFLKIHQQQFENIAFRQMSGKQVDGNVSVSDLLRVKGNDGNFSALPPTRVTRAFFALFWKINGASTMVFAITTQTSEWGDLYIELLDSVSLMPLGLLRADVYRLVLLAMVAHQRASNDTHGIVGKVKLWSSAAADGLSYLLHARPSTQINMKPETLRRSYLDTLKVSEQMGITAPAKTRKAVTVERIGKSAVCVLDYVWEPNGGQISTRADHAESIVNHINANPYDAQGYLKAIVKHSRSVTNLKALGESGIDAANHPSLFSAASDVNAKLDRGEVETVGDLEKLWHNMVSISRAERVDSLRGTQAAEANILKAATEVSKLSGRLLGQENLSLLFVPLETTILASASGLKCHAMRAFCRDDEADNLVAKMLTDKKHLGTLATGDDPATTDAAATSEDDRVAGSKIGAVPGDIAGGGDETVTKAEGTHARADREHPRGDGKRAGVEESDSCAGEGFARNARPKSVLLDPKPETKALLDQLCDRMRLAFEASDRSTTISPCRPLFDSPTSLLEVCEDRGLQFDTPVNARYSTAALIYLSENPEGLVWRCMSCKAAIKGVRFCCDTHAFIMCRYCVGTETAEIDRLVCPSGGCGTGVYPRRIPVLEGAPSTAAAAAPPSVRARASRRRTRSST